MTRAFHAACSALLALFLLAACATAPDSGSAPRPPTILVSIDGFRADYLNPTLTPELARLAKRGVHGAIRPSFPSKTFPNHYTLVTGLRPDHHGLVDNNMRDPEVPGIKFALSNREAVSDPRWWDGGEPLWATAERAGVRTATMFWPGSEAAIRGVRPSAWRTYNAGASAEQRVDQVLTWLAAPADRRPAFVTLYFDEVDTAGHHYGPNSAQVRAALQTTDAAVGRLVRELAMRGLAANLVIVSDHGMAEIAPERVVRLDELVPAEAGDAVTMGAFLAYAPAPGHEAQVEAALLQPHPHMECWRKAQVPERFHYGSHRRVPAIVCLPRTGWEIATAESLRRRPINGGDHGFDPCAPEMRALFLAVGPAFGRGRSTPLTDNVDVYPLLARLIGVAPQPNDGGLTLVQAALAR